MQVIRLLYYRRRPVRDTGFAVLLRGAWYSSELWYFYSVTVSLVGVMYGVKRVFLLGRAVNNWYREAAIEFLEPSSR